MMTKALADGLAARNGGAIANGPTLPRPRGGSRSWGGKTVATPVVTTLQPLGRCDARGCGVEAAGEDGMKAHARTHGGAACFSVVR